MRVSIIYKKVAYWLSVGTKISDIECLQRSNDRRRALSLRFASVLFDIWTLISKIVQRRPVKSTPLVLPPTRKIDSDISFISLLNFTGEGGGVRNCEIWPRSSTPVTFDALRQHIEDRKISPCVAIIELLLLPPHLFTKGDKSAKFGLILAFEVLLFWNKATYLKYVRQVESANGRPISSPYLMQTIPIFKSLSQIDRR